MLFEGDNKKLSSLFYQIAKWKQRTKAGYKWALQLCTKITLINTMFTAAGKFL